MWHNSLVIHGLKPTFKQKFIGWQTGWWLLIPKHSSVVTRENGKEKKI